MKSLLIALTLVWVAATANAADLRVASQKARADYESAQAEARESQQRILEYKATLTSVVADLAGRVDQLTTDIADLQRRLDELQAAETAQTQKQTEARMDMREYTGVIREAARELETTLSQSHFTAFETERMNRLKPVLAEHRFPGMDDITTISDLFFQEMVLSGEVDLRPGTVVDAGGTQTTADILTIGPFCAAYRTEAQTGFLRYGEENQHFFALSKAPPLAMRRNLSRYMAGDADAVHFDFSRGAALRQLTHRATLVDNIKQGGPIVWPILGIGLVALVIALERTLFLNRVHANTDRLMGRVNELAGRGDWSGCEKVLRHGKGKPVNNVLQAGLGAVNESRETLESVLQEAILKELPRLEHLLPALNIMGAVAPLLGLLGTVTGMIETFQAITLYGAGDPRMMSGGISEALVTTMLGLAVAIPIMLVHTFLRRRLEHIVGDMEEKAVALSNIICRECTLVPLKPVLPAPPGTVQQRARA
ncbi:biopolymer transporter ExbB [Desulfosarcina ovata subsp. sediminis]|uniref:Biopolymer transporter ExbB n=1 Tax=Desulfosarcina ovata subsp. sediminis TaxID=885957 RepID=A0A5K7ZYV9_9BACT|nr:MotA/TolQ/ExbB proton channel family protein [Desulfosarcina ovata]BBO85465.1 biopolymer transporter ExbB [Desulfosarcina ovata subsp. sediminis]